MQPERAQELLRAMQQQRLMLNTITYNSIISTSEKCKQHERALEVLGALQR